VGNIEQLHVPARKSDITVLLVSPAWQLTYQDVDGDARLLTSARLSGRNRWRTGRLTHICRAPIWITKPRRFTKDTKREGRRRRRSEGARRGCIFDGSRAILIFVAAPRVFVCFALREIRHLRGFVIQTPCQARPNMLKFL
jgi:hypothetical protein